MGTRIVSDPLRVFDFLSTLMPLSLTTGIQGLGLERDGELIAGTLYEGFSGPNVWVHLGAIPGKRWMTREYLHYCFYYPFVEMGVKRMSGYVNASNHEARRLDEHLGYELEATLKGAAPDGDDVLIYVMWRDKCRFLPKNLAVL